MARGKGRAGMSGNGLEARTWLYWMLPAAFVLHDAEELATMPAWAALHRSQIETLLATVGAAGAAAALPTTAAQVAVAMALMLAIFIVVTAGAWSRPTSRLWRMVYGGLLGAFFVHAFIHVAQSLAFGGYTPGVITAVLVVAPSSAIIYRSLAANGDLDRQTMVVGTALALALFIPAALLAFSVAAWLVPR
jgi:hypothetical protein